MTNLLKTRTCLATEKQAPTKHSLDDVVDAVRNVPIWNVRSGYGTAVLWDCGEPHIVTHEPTLDKALIHTSLYEFRRRRVMVSGAFRFLVESDLWIFSCSNGLVIDSNDTPSTKFKALSLANGQMITEIYKRDQFLIVRLDLDSEFRFSESYTKRHASFFVSHDEMGEMDFDISKVSAKS